MIDCFLVFIRLSEVRFFSLLVEYVENVNCSMDIVCNLCILLESLSHNSFDSYMIPFSCRKYFWERILNERWHTFQGDQITIAGASQGPKISVTPCSCILCLSSHYLTSKPVITDSFL